MAFLRPTSLKSLAAATGLALTWASAALAAPVAPEYSVKAVYLSKFAPFVEWPAAALPPGAPLQICIAGADPFGGTIDQALAGQAIADHRVQLVRLPRVDGQAPCHILYVRGSRTQSAAEALAAVRGKPVLTVTDEEDHSASHGVLHFVLVDSRVRFEVDPAAASAGGLMISSKLLSLALIVRAGAAR